MEGECKWVENDLFYNYAKKLDENGDDPSTKAQVSHLEDQIAHTKKNLNEFEKKTTETLTKLVTIEENTLLIVEILNGSDSSNG